MTIVAEKYNILYIDCSLGLCSVAVLFDDKIYNKTINNQKNQAAMLLPIIHQLITENTISLNKIDYFAVSNGPGRFTGLRIAVSCIQTLAYSYNKPVVAVSSLRLLAQQFTKEKFINNKQPNNKKLAICIKAYNNVYYTAIAVYNNNCILNIEQYIVKTKEDIASEINHNPDILTDYYLLGEGWLDFINNTMADDADDLIYLNHSHAQYGISLVQQDINNNANIYTALDPAILPDYGINPFK